MFSNVTVQVNMTIANGDCGGLEVRDQPTTNLSGYFVYLCTTGYYEFDVDVNGKETTLTSGNNSVFNNGLNQTHTIALTAIGNTFKLFVDSTAKYTFQWTDSTFSNGQIGLVAWDESTSTDAVFDHAKVWSSQ